MSFPVNILLSTFPGLGLPPTTCLALPSSTTHAELLEHIASLLPETVRSSTRLIVTSTSNRAVTASGNGTLLDYVRAEGDFVPLRLSVPLCGGKGGFGSQLRAAGGRMSSRKRRQNAELATGSARNLDGRRLRTITEAKNLAAYLDTKPGMDRKQKEERRRRWEQIVDLAEQKEADMRAGKGADGQRKGLSEEWLESKDEVGESVRNAVKTALMAGASKEEKKDSTNGDSSGSGGSAAASEQDSDGDDDEVMELDADDMYKLRAEAEAGDADALWVLEKRLKIPAQYLPSTSLIRAYVLSTMPELFSFVTAWVVAIVAVYRLIIYPLFLHPLRHIPSAHWSVPVFGDAWILYQRFWSRNNATTYKAHLEHGEVVRLGWNELSINCVDDGIKTIYGGGWEKHPWYPQQFASYGVTNMFSTVHHAPHSQKKRTIANIYSKSTLATSPQVAANSKVLLGERILPLIQALSESDTPADVYGLSNGITMDFMTAYQFGIANSTNFIQNAEARQHHLHVYHSRRKYEFYSAETPWLKPLCRRVGIALVPRVLDKANDFLEDFSKRMCRGADVQLQEPSSFAGDEPVVYKHFKTGLTNLRSRDALLGKELSKITLPTSKDKHGDIPDETTSEVYSEMLDHLGAGHETSAVALTYLMWEMSKDPELQAKLRAEVRTLTPTIIWPSSAPDFDSLTLPAPKEIDALPLLNAVLMETLRLHAPIPGMEPRVSPPPNSPAGHKLGQYTGIPGGIRVSSMPYVLHRNSEVFPSPETFNVFRWLEAAPAQLKEMNRWFWAFGSGGRMCIGSHLAQQELKLVVAAIYTNWETEIVDDEGIEAIDAYTVSPRSSKLILRFKRQTTDSPQERGSQPREYRGRTIGRAVANTVRRRFVNSPDPRTPRTPLVDQERAATPNRGSPPPLLRVNDIPQDVEQEEHLMAVNIAALSSMDLGMSGGAGHQQDLIYLYDKIQELSKLLASNREKVRELTKKAEEAGRRALANGSHPETDGEGSVQTEGARILELERELKQRDYLIEAYKHEQRENTGLIGLYEQTVGTMTEQIRHYCLGIEQRFLDQQKHYNNLLQLEKDDHLKSRLERDEYFAQTLKLSGQIRHAHRLRTDEWCDEFRVIAALQTQVRCLRRVVGWDAEKPEEEAGWEYLRECPLNDTGTGDGV
ncbi:hypothetical protein DV735_g576, partial [Chaetothyriales sp. CBS 134920]